MAKNEGSVAGKLLLLLVVLAGLGGGGYWYWKQSREKPVEYKTTAASLGDLIQVVTATGQLNPQTNVQVGSQVSGTISKLYADFNSKVTNGQVVAQLEPSLYKASVSLARADLASAKAALELAKAEQERSTALFSNKIVSKSDDDTALATFHQAEAMVMMKEAALEQAQANLNYTTIYAPVDGLVISRNVDVGQTVAASLSAPVLYVIANDLTKMQIDALVSEADIGGVETNQNVNFTVDAFPARVFNGVVVQIRNAPQTNQNVITYDTVIGVNNSDLKLRPGMTANVSIITAQRTAALRVPNSALRFHPLDAVDAKKESATNAMAGGMRAQGGSGQTKPNGGDKSAPGGAKPKGEHQNHTVYIVEHGPEGRQIPKPVQIKVGINDGMFTEVKEGLKEGDEVIVSQSVSAEAAAAAAGSPFMGRRF